ncbi:MAG TPA: hypothetical protein PKG52_13285, partial [bacterium]|nr:hypothetical protein [bacterium]
ERLFWLVSRVATAGGGYKLGYEYTKEKLKNAKDKNMIDQLEKELLHYENLISLSDAAEKYTQQTGKSPDKEMTELVKSGFLKSIPEDVFGGQYFFDEKDRKVKTTTEGDRAYKKKQEQKKLEELEKKKSEINFEVN